MALLVAPLLYGLVALKATSAGHRAFDERMRRDRAELRVRLTGHGATAQQVDDLMAYEADVSHDVSGYVQTASFASIGALMFLGVTLAGLVGFDRKSGARHTQSAAGRDAP